MSRILLRLKLDFEHFLFSVVFLAPSGDDTIWTVVGEEENEVIRLVDVQEEDADS